MSFTAAYWWTMLIVGPSILFIFTGLNCKKPKEIAPYPQGKEGWVFLAGFWFLIVSMISCSMNGNMVDKDYIFRYPPLEVLSTAHNTYWDFINESASTILERNRQEI